RCSCRADRGRVRSRRPSAKSSLHSARMDTEPPPPPAMDRLLESASGRALAGRHGRARAKEALREAADRWRAEGPRGDDAAESILAVAAAGRAAGFSTLEYDLVAGTRGRRGEHVRPLLLALFAKDRNDLDALAVTNAAAALLLALDTLANGRKVAVSRGELVAIGGDFRVPSILAKSGATLHEVGTTNRTTPRDYEEALEAGAGAVLKVRPSNYR